ncbi:MAG: 3'-5' exonuclease, partial [Anaerolineales bacterium]
NLFVVGDSDQSIYRWRGADYRNVLRFEEDFPGAEVILLEQNYRSTQNILDTAMAIIDRNTNRKKKQLFTERGAGEKIIIREAYDEREQAALVVEKIIQQIAQKKAAPGEFAVMYRTNAQSRLIEEAFLSANLPYKLVGAQRFYGRREVKDLIAYLRLVANPDDSFSLSRVINTPSRYIGTKTFSELVTIAGKNQITPGEQLLRLAEEESTDLDSFSTAAGKRLAAFGRMLSRWCKTYETLPPGEVLDQIIDDVGYRTYLEDGSEDGFERWENVVELRRLAAEYQTVGLLKFLEDVALVSDQDTLDPSQEVPTLLTLHAAKGLEFKQVMIIGVNEGILPHQRSFDDPEAMEEERRLFYVGVTRAKDRLYLFHSLNRYSFGYFEPLESPLNLLWWHSYRPDVLAIKSSLNQIYVILVECETK